MPRILVIDNEELIRGLLRDALHLEGYEVSEASNGREGVFRYRIRPTHMVIADIERPEMDGLETIRELRRMSAEVKIIVMSAHAQTRLDSLRPFKVQCLLHKPFRLRDVLQAVHGLPACMPTQSAVSPRVYATPEAPLHQVH